MLNAKQIYRTEYFTILKRIKKTVEAVKPSILIPGGPKLIRHFLKLAMYVT